MPSIRLNNLTLGYDRHPAVHHVDGDIAPGTLLAICGPNGAGKSTLLKGITGHLKPLGGSVVLTDCRARDIAYLPQSSDIDKSFPIDVFDMVAMGLWPRSGLFGSIGKKDQGRIAEAIASVGLTGFEDRPIGTLSGGQMQRVLFARLMVQDARVILLDEPFTAVDSKTLDDLLALVSRWHGEKRTIVAVLHDFDLVRKNFPMTLLMAREKIAWGPTDEALSTENLLKARRMIEAFDRQAHECEKAA